MSNAFHFIIGHNVTRDRWCKMDNYDRNSVIYVRGFAFYENKLLRERELANLLLKAFESVNRGKLETQVLENVKSLNGFFAIVFRSKDLFLGGE